MVGTTSLCRFRIFMTASVKLSPDVRKTETPQITGGIKRSSITDSCVTFCSSAFLSLNFRMSWKLCIYLHGETTQHVLTCKRDTIRLKKEGKHVHTSSEPSAQTAFLASCRAAGWSLSWCWPTSRATPVWGRRRMFSHTRFQNLRSRIANCKCFSYVLK